MLKVITEKKLDSMKRRGRQVRVDHGVVLEKLMVEGKKTKWFGIGFAPHTNKSALAVVQGLDTKPAAKAPRLAPGTRKSRKASGSTPASAAM